MITAGVEVRGLQPLIRKMDRAGGNVPIQRAMTKSVLYVQSVVADYPPHTSANVPPGNNGYSWYVRGSGTYTTTGRHYPTSEQLGQRWTTRTSKGGKRGHVENNASYAIYAQSRDFQASHMKRIGWETVEDSVEKSTDKIMGFFQKEYDKILGSGQ